MRITRKMVCSEYIYKRLRACTRILREEKKGNFRSFTMKKALRFMTPTIHNIEGET